jgi:hypothetical protein
MTNASHLAAGLHKAQDLGNTPEAVAGAIASAHALHEVDTHDARMEAIRKAHEEWHEEGGKMRYSEKQEVESLKNRVASLERDLGVMRLPKEEVLAALMRHVREWHHVSADGEDLPTPPLKQTCVTAPWVPTWLFECAQAIYQLAGDYAQRRVAPPIDKIAEVLRKHMGTEEKGGES